jgi:hypothetical protein
VPQEQAAKQAGQEPRRIEGDARKRLKTLESLMKQWLK